MEQVFAALVLLAVLVVLPIEIYRNITGYYD